MRASVRVDRAEMPSKGAAAVAALCGLVLGALGGGILAGALLGVLVLVAFGVWQAVTYLAAALTAGDRVDQGADVDEVVETVRIR